MVKILLLCAVALLPAYALPSGQGCTWNLGCCKETDVLPQQVSDPPPSPDHWARCEQKQADDQKRRQLYHESRQDIETETKREKTQRQAREEKRQRLYQLHRGQSSEGQPSEDQPSERQQSQGNLNVE